MYTALYKKWLMINLNSLQLKDWLIETNPPLTLFTKEEIIKLLQNDICSDYFKNRIIAKDLAYFFRLFDSYEFDNFLKKTDVAFKKNLILFFLSHYKDYCVYIRTFLVACNKSYWFYQCLPQIYELCQLEPSYFECIDSYSWLQYLLNASQLDSKILSYLFNDKVRVTYFFQYILKLSRASIPSFLNILKNSIYFDELFMQYKEDIYWRFLLERTNDRIFRKKYYALYLILEDILCLENMNLFDLQYLKEGGYVTVFQLKNYLLKLGSNHLRYDVLNTSSFLYAMVRKQIDELNFYIEITQITNTKGITKEAVYQVFKEEREKGNIWKDPKPENLGILEKDNGSYSFPIEPWTIGFEGANTQMKKAGEYVIIDLDLLWKEDDPCWEEVNRTLNLPWFKEYEERYQRERKLKK